MNKPNATWSSNLRALQLFIKRNNRMPKSGEQAINEETGTNLLGWYQNQVHQYKSGKLSQGRLLILNTQLGDKWYEGVSYLNNIIVLNAPLEKLYPNISDEFLNISVISMYKQGMVDKQKAINLLQRNITHLFKVYKSNPELCTIDNLKKGFYLPEYGYCCLYQAVKGYKSFIYVIQKNELEYLKKFVAMYRKTGSSLLEKNGLLTTVKCRIFDRMSETETSEKLNIPVNSVKAQIVKAVKLLSAEYDLYLFKTTDHNWKVKYSSIKDIGISDSLYNELRSMGYKIVYDFYNFYDRASSSDNIRRRIAEYSYRSGICLNPKDIEELATCLWKFKCEKDL